MRDESGDAVKRKSEDFHLCGIFNSTNVIRAIQENMGLVRGVEAYNF